MEKLLTQKDIADRWQVTPKAVSNWRIEGVISACKGVPVIRFSPQYISELEGVKIEKFSPLERKKLERDIEDKRRLIELKDMEISELKATISRIICIGAEIIYSNET